LDAALVIEQEIREWMNGNLLRMSASPRTGLAP